MKLLLKSIAFFASLALLCTSCAEDETSDVIIDPTTKTVVASSTIDGAIAGNGKVVLDLSVPIDDNIRSYTISWDGARTSSQNVTIAELYAYEGTEKVTIDTNGGYITVKDTVELAAGNYAISVDNVCKSNCESETSTWESIDVYDSSSYTTHPVEWDVEYTDNDELKIEWGKIPDHFRYMTITYSVEGSEANTSMATTYNLYPNKDEYGYGKIVEGEIVTIEGVKRDTEYYFSSYFRPSDAIDNDSENVALLDNNETTRVVPQNKLAESAPQSVTVQPGNGRVKVSWSDNDIITVDKTTIQIYESNGETEYGGAIVITDTDFERVADENDSDAYVVYIDGTANETSVPTGGLNKGTYIVKIWNTYDTDTDSEKLSYDVDVYSDDSYLAISPTPVVKYGGNVIISWANADKTNLSSTDDETDISSFKKSDYYSEFNGIEVEYDNYIETVVKADLSGFVEFAYADDTSDEIKITYSFTPEGGADVIEVGSTKTILDYCSSVSVPDIGYNSKYKTTGTAKFEGYNAKTARAQIMNGKGLKAFADLVNGNSNTAGAVVSASLLEAGYEFGVANTSLSAYIDSTSDILDGDNTVDVSDYSWESIGPYAAAYYGDFDGSSVNITGVVMRSDATDRQGFFGSIVANGSGGNKVMIENVTLVDPVIEGWDVSNVGGIAGYASRVEFHNCHLKKAETEGEPQGHVKIATEKAASEESFLGGIVGRLAGSSHYSELSLILNCSNEMPIYNETGGDAVGGIAGHVNESYIINTYNTGNITATSVNSPSNYGGVVGHIPSGCQDFQLIGCYNTGNITAASYVGGVVGWVQAMTSGDYVRIAACYNTGTVVSTGEFIGGVVGGLRKETLLYDLVGCYNYGPLYSSYQGTNGHAGAVVGGVGYGDADELGTTAKNAYSHSYFAYKDYEAVDEKNPVLWAIGTNSTHIDKTTSVYEGLDIDDSDQNVVEAGGVTTGSPAVSLATLNDSYLTYMNTALKTFYESNESQSLNGSGNNYGTDIKNCKQYWYGFEKGSSTSSPTLVVLQ